MANGGEDWPGWVQAIFAGTGAVGSALLGGFTVALRLSSRLDRIESRLDLLAVELGSAMDKKLHEDRHDNIYPTIERIANIPIQKLEEEVKMQGQNIAILLDRDRIEHLVERLVTKRESGGGG